VLIATGTESGETSFWSGRYNKRYPLSPGEFADVATVSTSKAHRLVLLNAKPVGQLLIHEIYQSIQGESSFAGLPCVFVRLAVCDSRCVWCDTPHAFNRGTAHTLEEVENAVVALKTRLVEITGGEPLLQDEVVPLMARLANRGLTVLLETSGAHDIGRVDRRVHIIMDLKCPDSGECDANRWENLEVLKRSDEIKFVIASRRDFDWSVDAVRTHRLHERFSVLLSPVFGVVQPVELAEWLLTSELPLRMQLQLHKYIWDPDVRGV
jgi:7-carboxy-7-deazaguanine synthase